MELRKINCPLKNGAPLLSNKSHCFSLRYNAESDGYYDVKIEYFHDTWDNWLDMTVYYPDSSKLDYMPCLPHGRSSVTLPVYFKAGVNTLTIRHNFKNEISIFDISVSGTAHKKSEISPNFDTLFVGDQKQIKVLLKAHDSELLKIETDNKEIGFELQDIELIKNYGGFRLHHKDVILNNEDVLALGIGTHKLCFILSSGEILYYTLTIAEEKKYDLEIVNFDIGCANSTLIKLPNGKNLLVDSSDDKGCRKVIMPFLKKHNIRIDYYLLTHFHSDHWGLLDELLEMNGIQRPDNDKVSELIKGENEKRIAYLKNFGYLDSTMLRFYDELGDIWDLGGAKITALNSRFDENGNPMKIHNFAYIKYNEHNFENSTSVSFLMKYNGFSYYHGADNYGFSQTRLHEDYKKWGKEEELSCQYYYANHHFHCDISADFVRTVNPTVVYVSVNESVYSRSTYAYDYLENVKDYRFGNKKLQDTIISFESGTAIAHVNSGNDWCYETKDNEDL